MSEYNYESIKTQTPLHRLSERFQIHTAGTALPDYKLRQDVKQGRQLTRLLSESLGSSLGSNRVDTQSSFVLSTKHKVILNETIDLLRRKETAPTPTEIGLNPSKEWESIITKRPAVTLSPSEVSMLDNVNFRITAAKVIKAGTMLISGALILAPFLLPVLLPTLPAGLASILSSTAIVGTRGLQVNTLITITFQVSEATEEYSKGTSLTNIMLKHGPKAILKTYLSMSAVGKYITGLAGAYENPMIKTASSFFAAGVSQLVSSTANSLVLKFSEFAHIQEDTQEQLLYRWAYDRITNEKADYYLTKRNNKLKNLNSEERTMMAQNMANSGWSLSKLINTSTLTTVAKRPITTLFQVGMASTLAFTINANALKVWNQYLEQIEGGSTSLDTSGSILNILTKSMGILGENIIKPLLAQWLIAEATLIPRYIEIAMTKYLGINTGLEKTMFGPVYRIIKGQIFFGLSYNMAEWWIYGGGAAAYCPQAWTNWSSIYDKLSTNISSFQTVCLGMVDSWQNAFQSGDSDKAFPQQVAEDAITKQPTIQDTSNSTAIQTETDSVFIEQDYVVDPTVIQICTKDHVEFETSLITLEQELSKVEEYDQQTQEMTQNAELIKQQILSRIQNIKEMKEYYKQEKMVQLIEKLGGAQEQELLERWDTLVAKTSKNEGSNSEQEVSLFVASLLNEINTLNIDEPTKQNLTNSLQSGNIPETIMNVKRLQTSIELNVWGQIQIHIESNREPDNDSSLDIVSRWSDIHIKLGRLLIEYAKNTAEIQKIYIVIKNKADQMNMEKNLMEKSITRAFHDWTGKVKELGIDNITNVGRFDTSFAYSPANIEETRTALNVSHTNLREFFLKSQAPTVFQRPIYKFRSPVKGTQEQIIQTHSETLKQEITFLRQEQTNVKQSFLKSDLATPTFLNSQSDNQTYVEPIIMPLVPDIFTSNVPTISDTAKVNTLNNTQIDTFFLNATVNCIFKRALFIQQDIGESTSTLSKNMINMVTNLIQTPTLTQAVLQDTALPLPILSNGTDAYKSSMNNIYTVVGEILKKQKTEIDSSSNVTNTSKLYANQIPLLEPWANQYRPNLNAVALTQPINNTLLRTPIFVNNEQNTAIAIIPTTKFTFPLAQEQLSQIKLDGDKIITIPQSWSLNSNIFYDSVVNMDKIQNNTISAPKNIEVPQQVLIPQDSTAYVTQSQVISVTPSASVNQTQNVNSTQDVNQTIVELEKQYVKGEKMSSPEKVGSGLLNNLIYMYDTFIDTISAWFQNYFKFAVLFETTENTERMEKLNKHLPLLSKWLAAGKERSNQTGTYYSDFQKLLGELGPNLQTGDSYSGWWAKFRKSLTLSQSETIDKMFIDYESDLANLKDGLIYDGGERYTDLLDIGYKGGQTTADTLASQISKHVSEQNQETRSPTIFTRISKASVAEFKYWFSVNKMSIDDATFQNANNAGQAFSFLTDQIDKLIELEQKQYQTGTGDPILSYILMMVSLRCSSSPNEGKCSLIEKSPRLDLQQVLWEAYMNSDITTDRVNGPRTDYKYQSPFVSTLKKVVNSDHANAFSSDQVTALHPDTVKSLALGCPGSSKVRYYHDRYVARTGALSQQAFTQMMNSEQTTLSIENIIRQIPNLKMPEPLSFKQSMVVNSKLLGLFKDVPVVNNEEMIKIAQDNSSIIKNTFDSVINNIKYETDKVTPHIQKSAEKMVNQLQYDGVNLGTSLVMAWYRLSTGTNKDGSLFGHVLYPGYLALKSASKGTYHLGYGLLDTISSGYVDSIATGIDSGLRYADYFGVYEDFQDNFGTWGSSNSK